MKPAGEGKTRGSLLLHVVLGLLGGTAVLLGWVGIHAVEASGDASVRSGLDYETFLGAVDDLISDAGDSTLVRFDEVEASRAGKGASSRRRFSYDTIVVVADTAAFPSLRRAGFLHDQVRAYNAFQRERVALGKVAPDWFERLRPYNPSIFRAYRRPDESVGLTRAPAAWSLRVRSPLEGEWDGEVLAQDVHRDHGLVGPRMAISLREPGQTGSTGADGGQSPGGSCELVPASSEVRAYCLSEERIAQATFLLGSDQRGPFRVVAGWTDLWLDARKVRAGDSVEMPEGSILRLSPMEPVTFARYWEGVLSSKQWINGRLRRQTEAPPPLDLLAGLGNASRADGTEPAADASIGTTVYAGATAELTSTFSEFTEKELSIPLDFGMIVLARVPGGEIVGLAEAGERRNLGRSPILERVAPGSAVKPLLAAAILWKRPDLANLKIRARSGSVSSVLGLPRVPQRRAFTTALNCAPPASGWVDLRYFLRCSNNEFAASLVAAGLTEAGLEPGRIPLEGTLVPRATLLRSPLSEGLTHLYDLPSDPAIADSVGRSRRVWEGLVFSDGTPVRVPTELLPSGSRPALLAPGSRGGTDLSLIYRYAYGAWENQWTLLDLTNAFARVTTDRRVRLTFAPGGMGGGRDGAESLGLSETSWYDDFLGGLRDVARDGTARGLKTAWERVGLPPMVLAKTGTLAEPGGPGPADDLFSKALLFAVGDPADDEQGPLGCGLVGGIYLRFSEGPSSGSLPNVQVQFAEDRLGEFLRAHWAELSGCKE